MKKFSMYACRYNWSNLAAIFGNHFLTFLFHPNYLQSCYKFSCWHQHQKVELQNNNPIKASQIIGYLWELQLHLYIYSQVRLQLLWKKSLKHNYLQYKLNTNSQRRGKHNNRFVYLFAKNTLLIKNYSWNIKCQMVLLILIKVGVKNKIF